MMSWMPKETSYFLGKGYVERTLFKNANKCLLHLFGTGVSPVFTDLIVLYTNIKTESTRT